MSPNTAPAIKTTLSLHNLKTLTSNSPLRCDFVILSTFEFAQKSLFSPCDVITTSFWQVTHCHRFGRVRKVSYGNSIVGRAMGSGSSGQWTGIRDAHQGQLGTEGTRQRAPHERAMAPEPVWQLTSLALPLPPAGRPRDAAMCRCR